MRPKNVLSLGMTDQKDMTFGPLRTQLQEILFVWLKMLLNIRISGLRLEQCDLHSFHALLSNAEIQCQNYSVLKFVLDTPVSYTKL